MLYSIDYINLITERSDVYQIDGLNYICSTILGGTGGHSYDIDALNEICTLQGVAAGHKYNIDALNAICSGSYKYEDEAWSYIQSSAVLNPYPAPSLQSFASDLTVIEVSGSYYFKAQKGSNLLITGYDFPTGWTKGFPYKSAATIDIFGQTGVPVTSLFQNFDYENQYFTKHVAQVVDGNGVELSEAYVSAIVAYSEPLTGADLTAANTYFAPEVASTYHLDPVNGADTNNATTKALARKTVTSVEGLITTGGVNIYSGSITDTSLLLSKAIDWIGKGKAIFKTPATTNGVIRSGNTSNIRTFKGLIIDAQAANTFIGYYITMKNITLQRCLLVNPKNTDVISTDYATAPENNSIDGIIINSGTVSHFAIGAFVKMINSFVKITASTAVFRPTVYAEFKYNRLSVTGTVIYVTNIGVDAQYNEITQLGKSPILVDNVTTGHTNATKFNYNKVNYQDINGNYMVVAHGVNSLLKNNTISLTGRSVASTDNTTIILAGFGAGLDMSNNTITAESERILDFIIAYSGGVTCTGLKINNNIGNSKRAIGGFTVDGEKTTTEHHKFDGFEMNNNTWYGPAHFGNSYSTGHGLFIWGNDGSCRGNFIEGEKIGHIVKSNGATCTINTSALNGVGNRIKNCNISLYIKGTSGLVKEDFICDTSDSNSDGNMIDIVKNGSYVSQNNTIKNSTFIYRGSNASFSMFYLDDAANLTGMILTGNTYFTTNPNRFAVVGSTVYDFAGWCALTGDNGTLLTTAPPVTI